MLKRKIYDDLVKWKNTSNGSSALMIDGARRVGKSFIVEEFAKNEYKSYIIIDFGNYLKKLKTFLIMILMISTFSFQSSLPTLQKNYIKENH